ncbi:MAG: hypothetical protein DMF83_27825 [Acidobacteria bacterium]|nr:MAG: hypothetical protein DMF83_27825 [Acidobacteriota bacterium]
MKDWTCAGCHSEWVNFITFEPDPGTTTLDKSIDCPKCGLGALMMGKPGERIVNVDTRLKEAS